MGLFQRVLLAGMVGTALAGCSGPTLKAAGDACFASSECDLGLTCDFGRDPPVCAGEQTTEPDGGPVADARVVDAAPLPDGVIPPDGAVPPDGSSIDAPEIPIDAPIVQPPDAAIDAPIVEPDAAPAVDGGV